MSQKTTSDVAAENGPAGGTKQAQPAPPGPPAPARAGAYDSPARRRLPLLPALLFLIVVTQAPFVATLVISFIDWKGLRPDDRKFAGLENYRDVLGDPTCGRRS